jgi:hypothetical protein
MQLMQLTQLPGPTKSTARAISLEIAWRLPGDSLEIPRRFPLNDTDKVAT